MVVSDGSESEGDEEEREEAGEGAGNDDNSESEGSSDNDEQGARTSAVTNQPPHKRKSSKIANLPAKRPNAASHAS